ncbi:HAD family hydrolase [Acidithiobacillus sp.]
MAIEAVYFDLYGTLINIETNETMEEIYRAIAHYLTFHGISFSRGELRDRYYAIMKEMKRESPEKYPEIDVAAIWEVLLAQENSKPAKRRAELAQALAQLYRAISRTRLQRYEGAKRALKELQQNYRLGMISDAQPCFALPEMKAMKIKKYFDVRVISGDYGFRKPDPRLFEWALEKLGVRPHEAIYVGNDMYRDVYGAQRAGMKTIFVDSNQGAKSYNDTAPDYYARDLFQVLEGVAFLAEQGRTAADQG